MGNRNAYPERKASVTGQPAFNDEGIIHVYAKGPEAAELAEQVHKQRGVNVDHGGEPVFNPASTQRQAKAMFAAKAGHSTLGIPADVGADFTKGFTGRPGSVKALPASASKRKHPK
jgi:hypothetical protein